MKALILAAGFGTRLLPHTETTPKPLFTLAGKTVLAITIERLIGIGCTDIMVNTHHLHKQIKTCVDLANFAVPVHTIHEPLILDTGGAIKNVKDFMGSSDFMVINADIATNIDLKYVRQFHSRGNWPVTLVLHDRPEFNKVEVDPQGFVCGFSDENTCLAFTGIQVLSPEIFDHMPEKSVFSSIDLYKSLANKGPWVKAFVATSHFWEDIGTPLSYERVALRYLAMAAFARICKNMPPLGRDTMDINYPDMNFLPIDPIATINPLDITIDPIKGDGSDRRWFRAFWNDLSVVICSHGISDDFPHNRLHDRLKTDRILEIDSFMAIGDHLDSKKIPVPRIFARDRFSGMVALEDLGDTHFTDIIASTPERSEKIKWYCRVVDLLIEFSLKGKQGFDPKMAFQTLFYSKELIIEKECLYFIEAFLKGFLKQDPPIELLLPEFSHIADKALEGGLMGLMHRDFQSKNLMVKNNGIFCIDFQSARLGPLQYDLASLLIDPYVVKPDEPLDGALREEILAYCIAALTKRMNLDKKTFISSYRHCCVTRNFQILGAFSYLGMVKRKSWFTQYIPCAVSTLKKGIVYIDREKIPTLNALIERLQG